jgi:meso-butanediol dehydrogenase/(S,S)-butanediol dehydrogenase/diacetyl reductase
MAAIPLSTNFEQEETQRVSKRYNEKVALVTGAASGIGKATAMRLASEGARLVLADINLDALTAVAEELSGIETECVRFDATDADSCRAMVTNAEQRFGRLDLLCNIAGIAGAWRLEAMTQKQWELMLSINLTSVFVITQAALPLLLESRGNVVNMASASGLQGQPYNSAYCAVKAGVIGFTKSVAAEFGSRGLRANAVCPGGVLTPIYDNYSFPEDADQALVNRMLPLPGVDLSTPEEIAGLVAYVGSDEARFINGTTLSIDGGQTAL